MGPIRSRWGRATSIYARVCSSAQTPQSIQKAMRHQRADPGSSCAPSAFLCTSARRADRGPRAGSELRSRDDLRQSPVGAGDQGHRIRSGLQRQQCCAAGMDLPHTSRWRGRRRYGTPRSQVARRWLPRTVRSRTCAWRVALGSRRRPSPLTQIHFQDLVRLPGGGARVNVTTQPFDIPVCGRDGASGSTVTTYRPTNLCVSPGRLCRPQRRGRLRPQLDGSATLPERRSLHGDRRGARLHDGLVHPQQRRRQRGHVLAGRRDLSRWLGLQPQRGTHAAGALATGRDATPICPAARRRGPAASRSVLPPIRIGRQTDGLNHRQFVAVAIYCRLRAGCNGVATLTPTGRQARKASYGHTSFSLRGNTTSHVPIRVTSRMIQLVRRYRGGVSAALTAVVRGKTVTQTIVLRIF